VRIHPAAIVSAKTVVQNLNGRSADGGLSLPWLGSMVAAAGPGNHLDIGSLFGASAITAALVKKELKHSGKVYCLDPYEPRDPSMKPPNMPDALFNATGEALMHNAEKLGVELELIQKKSQPWPEELDKVLFSSAFVDGDHKNGAPWLDFQECAKRTSGYIGIDNCEEGYPDVVDAMVKAMQTNEWFLYFKNNLFVALRRTLPTRGEGTPLQVM